ncbi:MAG: class II aldolase/adducin family protein, partial [Pseudomonadota bacterium]
MNAAGLNQGASGNASRRGTHADHGPGLWITPTGMAYDALTPEDCPFIDAKGAHHGPRRPSSEWRFHYDILMARR